MAETYQASAGRERRKSWRITSFVRFVVVAAVFAAMLLGWPSLQARAVDVAPSEIGFKTKTPAVSALTITAPPVNPPVAPSRVGVLHAFQSLPAASGEARNAPVVRLAQPISAVEQIRMPVRQVKQESIPPGGTEYGRGTGVPPIGSLTINTLPSTGQLPEMFDRIESMEAQLGSHEFHRDWLNYSYFWEAPAFYNRPLYFQEVNLERYGYNWGVFQPFVSGAMFYVKIPLLPYMMTVHPPCECVYSLGYYRPGSCVPYQINWPEVRLDAAIVEGAFITGLCFLIP